MPSISLIASVTANNAIGRRGELLFHISEDLKNFKRITMGHPVVMGRRTFESLPNGPLPGRLNIVVTRNRDFPARGAAVASSFANAITIAAEQAGDDAEVMVIGGGEIYSAAMPLASKFYLTEISTVVEDADTFFPPFDPSQWKVDEESPTVVDPKTGVPYRFICLSRR